MQLGSSQVLPQYRKKDSGNARKRIVTGVRLIVAKETFEFSLWRAIGVGGTKETFEFSMWRAIGVGGEPVCLTHLSLNEGLVTTSDEPFRSTGL